MSEPFDVRLVPATDIGRMRKANQDSLAYFAPPEPEVKERSGWLLIVADGVGGEAHGEVASRYAADKVLHDYYQHAELAPGERLRLGIQESCQEIYNYWNQNPGSGRMATTVAAAAIRGGQLFVGNVGDSRVYLIRAGGAVQISQDHSLVGELVRAGSLTEAEAQQSKKRNQLTRSVGGQPSVNVDVFNPMALEAGDRVLVCSDGITRYYTSTELAQLAGQGPIEQAAGLLVSGANEKGGADNISLLLAEILPAGSLGSAPMVCEPVIPPAPIAQNFAPPMAPPPPVVPPPPNRPALPAQFKLPLGVWIGGAVFILLLVVVGVALAFSQNGPSDKNATATQPRANITRLTETAAAKELLGKIETVYPTFGPTITSAPTLEPDTPTPLPLVVPGDVVHTPTKDKTVKNTPLPATQTLAPETKANNSICLYNIQNQTLAQALNNFRPGYTRNFSYVRCVNLTGAPSCDIFEPIGVSNPEKTIIPDAWVAVPGAVGPACTNFGGKMVGTEHYPY